MPGCKEDDCFDCPMQEVVRSVRLRMYFAGRGNRTYESVGSSGIKAASSSLLLGRLVGLLSCSHIRSCCVWGAYLLSTRRSEGALDPTSPEMRGEGG